jgi:hypothetical protein
VVAVVTPCYLVTNGEVARLLLVAIEMYTVKDFSFGLPKGFHVHHLFYRGVGATEEEHTMKVEFWSVVSACLAKVQCFPPTMFTMDLSDHKANIGQFAIGWHGLWRLFVVKAS